VADAVFFATVARPSQRKTGYARGTNRINGDHVKINHRRMSMPARISVLASGSLAWRLLFALMGAFAGATLGWVAWGILTPGDFFANGSPFVGVTVLALAGIGGYAVFARSSRGARITAATCTVACATFWLAAPDGWWANPPPPSPEASPLPSADDLRDAERETGLTFPESTRVLVWRADKGHNRSLEIKFEMANADWPAFLSASPFRDQPLREDAPAHLGVDHGPWGPYQVAHLLKGEFRTSDAHDLNLGADKSRPDVVVVYVVWHET
jgi:hypothetical protein